MGYEISNEKVNVQVLALADRYEVMHLREICSTRLSKVLNLTNITDVWLTAYQHGIKELTHDAVVYMTKNWKELVKKGDVLKLIQKYPDLLITISTLLAECFVDPSQSKASIDNVFTPRQKPLALKPTLPYASFYY